MKLTIRKRTLGTIPLLEVVPKEKRNQTLPLIIYYHGWQSAKELNLTQARHLAHEGFRVILPDAANHGERKQPISKIPSLTFWQSIHTNLMEFGYILHHFQKMGLAGDEIGVGGISMGGITTCALLTHHPEIKAAACVMGSPKPLAYRERIVHHATTAGRYFPDDYRDLLDWVPKYDLSLHPETIAGRPLFFWHGQQDHVVPYDDVVEFVEEHPEKANIQFIDENEGHLVKVETMEKVVTFFTAHLRT
ncbi:alpha/beta fold hydrolase [Jeotgalibaca caeni]|uniref:alpha/beta fold hydrolase n=1 Tax=Jeotgalibaca caeni TaxID=3028623 RepID=UPI00237EE402|nr:alpha/beta fold hydrolase [Jeotgalibaca caeni]MDE1548258.1 alpha/beta fold hydrolase [Jeotgalibaca caeni]